MMSRQVCPRGWYFRDEDWSNRTLIPQPRSLLVGERGQSVRKEKYEEAW